jgi:hypothetical protein
MPAVTQNRLLNVVRVSSAPDATWLSATDVSAHRVLLFPTTSWSSGGSASRVLGQPDFTSSSAGAMAAQLNFPRGAYIDESRVMIADQFNHRVSMWTTFPATNGAAADLALGTSSPDVAGVPDPVSASTLRQPSSVVFGMDNVYVGDTGNHRVLIWNGLPTTTGMPANIVVGQFNFSDAAPGQDRHRFRDPDGVFAWNRCLFVADTTNNRVLVFCPIPTANYAAATSVIGQDDLDTVITAGAPDATHLNKPHGVCVVTVHGVRGAPTVSERSEPRNLTSWAGGSQW